jgi:hypothetical protein
MFKISINKSSDSNNKTKQNRLWFTLRQVGVGVSEARRLTGLSTEQTVQIWTSLVLATGFNGVALRATSDEDFLAVFNAHFRLLLN